VTLRRATALLMLVLTLSTIALETDPRVAEAAERRSLCARTANLRDSPEGFVIGRLRRPQRLTLIRRSANRRWAQVRTRTGLVGWLPARSVCRAR
jgi:hypothetical protein